jgi:type I restriction-modification system DNA methylase subunit
MDSIVPPETDAATDTLERRLWSAADQLRAKVNDAMREIEKHYPQLAGVLPKTYNLFSSTMLKKPLKKVSEIPATVDYKAFGRIYEFFLHEFASTSGGRFVSSARFLAEHERQHRVWETTLPSVP